MSDVQKSASGLKVRALPWQSNTPRDGTWWVGIRPQCRHSWEFECCGGNYVIASDPRNKFAGTSKEAAIAELRAFIYEAERALSCLGAGTEFGPEEDPDAVKAEEV